MKTNSLLISFPSFPYTLASLLPNRPLASIAATLIEEGHCTQILDYGTAGMIEGRSTGASKRGTQKFIDLLRKHPSEQAYLHPVVRQELHALLDTVIADQDEFCQEVAKEITRRKGISFVIFHLEHGHDYHALKGLAIALRRYWSRMPLFLTGSFAQLAGKELPGMTDLFNGICYANPEETIPLLAARIHQPHLWTSVPNLHLNLKRRILSTEYVQGATVAQHPAPRYDVDTYPALTRAEKVMAFDIEDARLEPTLPWTSRKATRVAIKPAINVVREMRSIRAMHREAVFHFSSRAATRDHISAVAREILKHGMNVRYQRNVHVCDVLPDALPLLKVSGCQALNLNIFSGSQLLLDRYYLAPIGVSQIEHILRAAKNNGMFTTAHVEYPCPDDDYHSQAETVRLLQRTKPHAVIVDLPWVESSSATSRSWMARRIYRQLMGWSVGPVSRRRLLDGVPRSLETIYCENEQLIGELSRQNIALLSGPDTGLLSALSDTSDFETSVESGSCRAFLGTAVHTKVNFVETMNESLLPGELRHRIPFWNTQAVVGN